VLAAVLELAFIYVGAGVAPVTSLNLGSMPGDLAGRHAKSMGALIAATLRVIVYCRWRKLAFLETCSIDARFLRFALGARPIGRLRGNFFQFRGFWPGPPICPKLSIRGINRSGAVFIERLFFTHPTFPYEYVLEPGVFCALLLILFRLGLSAARSRSRIGCPQLHLSDRLYSVRRFLDRGGTTP